MRMIKKLALVLVASAFVVGAVAGCGEKSNKDKAKDAIDDAASGAKDALGK